MNVGFDIRIIEEGVIDWDEPTVITGFPGPGFVGETTAMYIIDSLQLREIGHVDSELIPPMLVVMGPSLRPPFRIHANEDADLIIIVDNQPIPMEHHRVQRPRPSPFGPAHCLHWKPPGCIRCPGPVTFHAASGPSGGFPGGYPRVRNP